MTMNYKPKALNAKPQFGVLFFRLGVYRIPGLETFSQRRCGTWHSGGAGVPATWTLDSLFSVTSAACPTDSTCCLIS